MTSGPFVLSIDIGTSSIRAGLFDRAGLPHGAAAQQANLLRTDAAGMAVLNPGELLQGIASVIDAVMTASSGRPVAGVGISSFWHSLVGVDTMGKPTTDILTWADRRAGGVAAVQRAKAAAHPQEMEASLHGRTGCPLHSSYWTAKLPWLRAAAPEVCSGTARWLSAADLAMASFFGRTRTSVSLASGTGLFDVWEMRWLPEAAALAEVDAAALPDCDDEPYVGLLPAFAARWPRLAGIPWFPAVGDGACSNIGVGGIDPDTLVLMLGTSGSLRMMWEAGDARPHDPAMWFYRVDARRLAGGMAMSEGGASAAWARAVIGTGEADDDAIEALAPDTHGLTVLPYVLGARSPDWADGRTACLAGITAATTPADIQRAMLESVGLSIALLKSRLERTMPRARHVVVTGGALSRSKAWRQIVADCIGHDVELSDSDEGSLRGAALIAIERLGMSELASVPFGSSARICFDPAAHAKYAAALARRVRLDAALKPLGL